ncbi:MAG: CehA/McbA family metallohydrolase [Fibrobacteria bacterium]|nr:CehA/McbA family metallohydrolase [Fibrobacteria bacterium]
MLFVKILKYVVVLIIPLMAAPEWDWYTADMHMHVNGCNNTNTPIPDILQQMKTENINIGSILIWGNPTSLANDVSRFRGQEDDPISEPGNIIHWDVEISGLPGNWHGHVSLLNVAQKNIIDETKVKHNYPGQDYLLPNYKYIQDQGGLFGFQHLMFWGWQWEPPPNPQPACCQPREMPMDVTQAHLDFVSTELINKEFIWLWYSMLQAGFQIPILGDSDLGCIHDTVGYYHAAFPLPKGDTLSYVKFIEAIKKGRTVARKNNKPPDYLDIRVNEVFMGDTVYIAKGNTTLKVEVDASTIESGKTVELVMNSEVIKSETIGSQKQTFSWDVTVEKSSWLAARIPLTDSTPDYEAHTSSIFVLMDGCPIRNDPTGARNWKTYLDKYYQISVSENQNGSSSSELQEKINIAKAVWEDIALEGEGNKEMTCVEPVTSIQKKGKDTPGATLIEFSIDHKGLLSAGELPGGLKRISIFDIQGKLVSVVQGLSWDGKNIVGQLAGDGVYFARFEFYRLSHVVRFSLVR